MCVRSCNEEAAYPHANQDRCASVSSCTSSSYVQLGVFDRWMPFVTDTRSLHWASQPLAVPAARPPFRLGTAVREQVCCTYVIASFVERSVAERWLSFFSLTTMRKSCRMVFQVSTHFWEVCLSVHEMNGAHRDGLCTNQCGGLVEKEARKVYSSVRAT